MKVLFHIDSESNWDMVLENARNMRKYEQERQVAFEIEIVANGAAVEGLQRAVAQQSCWYASMAELSVERVVFAACRNALRKHNIDPGLLCEFVRVVPSGVVEIAMRQEEGYSYIKP